MAKLEINIDIHIAVSRLNQHPVSIAMPKNLATSTHRIWRTLLSIIAWLTAVMHNYEGYVVLFLQGGHSCKYFGHLCAAVFILTGYFPKGVDKHNLGFKIHNLSLKRFKSSCSNIERKAHFWPSDKSDAF